MQEKIKDDTISRQAAIDVLEERLQANGYSDVKLVSELNRSIGYIMRLPSAQSEPSEITDKHEMYESVLRERLADDSGSYDVLIPCKDTISRQDAINAINRVEVHFTVKSTIDLSSYQRETNEIINHILDAQENALKELPPAEPEVRTGKWRIYAKVDKDNRMNGEHDLVCNQCGYFVENIRSHYDIPRFCGGCGAIMEGWR